MECRDAQPNDLSRSLVALEQNSTIIAVVELSQPSCARTASAELREVPADQLRFAPDSPLEGDGFELPVPVRQAKLTRFCR
jgi:hypothetical protein